MFPRIRSISFAAAARALAAGALLGLLVGLPGCSNNPYPAGATAHSTLFLFMGDDPRTLDPTKAYSVSEAEIVDLIYPSYFRYHYLRRNPFVLELNLGAEQPRREPYTYMARENGRMVEKHGESWIFRIKRGLRFQDDPAFPGGKGRTITAADFLYSFRRMADPAVQCPVLNYFEDKVIGLHEYAEYNRNRAIKKLPADYKRPVEGLQLDPHDPYVFRVLLNQPYPQLRYMMTMHFTTPIPREAAERYGSEYGRHPVGCGPYMLKEYSPKLRIVLKINPNRHKEVYPSDGMPGDREAGLLRDAGKQLPFAKKIVLTTVKEGITGWNLFLQGYLDVYSVTQTNFQQVMTQQGTLSPEMKQRGISLYRSTPPAVFYFAFNMRDPAVGGYSLKKRKLRQAISTAFDAQAFIDLQSQGFGTPIQFLIPDGIPGFDPKYHNPYRQYSVAKAKKLLAEAGFPNGIDKKTGERLTVYFDNPEVSAAGRQRVGLVAKQFEAIDIHMESRSWRPNVWEEKVMKREHQFIFYGWIADYPDPENFALLLYGPTGQNMGPNYALYDNPVYNRLFEQMRSMDDGPRREAIIRHMRAVAVEDCPWIFLDNDDNLMLAYNWVQNIKPHPVANDFLKYWRVDGPERARMQAKWNKPNYWPAIVAVALFILGVLPAAGVVRKRRNRRVRIRPGGTS